MAGNFSTQRFEVCVTVILTFVSAGFVPKRPHQNRRIVFVAFIHPMNAIPVMLFPFQMIADFVYVVNRPEVTAVGFDIRFVNHIKTKLGAELNQQRVGRIMRRPDAVYIVAFHQC